MQAHPPTLVLRCSGKHCNLAGVSAGQDRSAAHVWTHLAQLAGGTTPEATPISALLLLTARAISMEAHTQEFKATCKELLHALAHSLHCVLGIRVDELLADEVAGIPLIHVSSRPVRVDAAIRSQIAESSGSARHGRSWGKGFNRALLSRKRKAGVDAEHTLHESTLAGFGMQEMVRYWIAGREATSHR
eukprot:1192676-Amphidinium_carterae.1